MTDTPPTTPDSGSDPTATPTGTASTARPIQEPVVTMAKTRLRLSFVWLFPLIAMLVALVLVWREYSGRGPVIQISFETASGLTAGETPIKFRNVEVGRIESLHFSDDLSRVIAVARLTPDVAPYVDEGAQFWVVRPEVSARGISGLETVITGSYVEGSWDATPGTKRKRFVAHETPPLTTSDTPGRRIMLRAPDGGSLSVGAPVFFRQVEVGHVESKRLTDDGEAVEFQVFIDAPNDRRLSHATRFWNVSGVDLNLGADGARLRIASLSSLIQGGASFDNVAGGSAEPVPDDHVYTLFGSETEARDLAMDMGPGSQLLLNVHFVGSLNGLKVGAPVQYQGIRIGRVADISAKVKREEKTFSNRVVLAISPSLLGMDDGDAEAALDFLDTAVARGLRAQLSSSSLLTGALLVRFVNADLIPGEDPQEIRRFEDGLPRMPSIGSDFDNLTGSVEGMLQRIDGLPIEEMLANATLLLENTNRLIAADETRAIPAETLAAIMAMRDIAASPAIAKSLAEAEGLLTALRGLAESDDLAAARRDLAATLASTASIAAELERSRTVEEMAATIAALRRQIENPEIEATIAALRDAMDAATLILANPALTETPGALNGALTSMEAFLSTPGLREAPEQLTGALAAARKVLTDLDEGGAAREISAAAASARALLDDPALRTLSNEAAATAAALREMLQSPGAENLPAAAATALSSAALLIDQLREENLAATAANALAGVGRASDAVVKASADVPALMRRLTSVATRADEVLASVGVGSELNYETITAIREIRDAARAITDLTDLLARQPNSLILGK